MRKAKKNQRGLTLQISFSDLFARLIKQRERPANRNARNIWAFGKPHGTGHARQRRAQKP